MVRETTGVTFGSNSKVGAQASNFGQIVRGDHMHQIWVKWQGGTTGVTFGSNSKRGPQASNFGQIVRGDHRHQILVK